MKVLDNKVEEAKKLFPFNHTCYKCGSPLLVDLEDIKTIKDEQFHHMCRFDCGACGSNNASQDTKIVKAAKLLLSLV